MTNAGERLARAIAAIDAANAGDPETIVVRGERRPKEQAHAELMTEWLGVLDPAAGDEQLLAARAHHLRRWSIPRSQYPDGRAGYLRWRNALSRQHATEVATILEAAGYPPETITRVQQLIRKEGLGRDPDVQAHEDARCLVFVETQLADLVARLGHDRAVEVVAKTLRKMSPAAIGHARSIPLPDPARSVFVQAMAVTEKP